MTKSIILTGDRPTGKLHIGHYVGSLKKRVELQDSGKYDSFIMIADIQALTDNARNPAKIRENLLEVVLDYLAVGIDPIKSTIFIQSQISELFELTTYYMNLVTLARLERNPTVKSEINDRGFNKSIPIGFLTYPISQAADITAFKANLVPVGEDQLPMIEQTREIVRSFNNTYKCNVLVEPEALIPTDKNQSRLPGIDGNAKMSKSLNNSIYLSDDEETLHQKIMQMYTDPNHIKIDDPGKVDGNTVFTYLDIFGDDKKTIAEMKNQYQHGGLGDVTVKNYLNEILQMKLKPIRQQRLEYAKDMNYIRQILQDGSKKAQAKAAETLAEVRAAIGVNYFG
jgi:tryptophanyl-tRNA synthetase